MLIPPGLTCHACRLPVRSSIVRRTQRGLLHADKCRVVRHRRPTVPCSGCGKRTEAASGECTTCRDAEPDIIDQPGRWLPIRGVLRWVTLT